MLRIGLLGPLYVRNQDTPLQLPAAKHRSLLAALAVEAGKTVPVDALAEAIWDSRPPASWPGTLRNYVRRLRKALGPEAGGRIVTASPGYALQADPDEIDILVFESMCKAGMASARNDDWKTAAVTLSEALTLCRGTPFADIPSQVIRDAYVPYLEEMRLTALETRIEADLEISAIGPVAVVPELYRLITRHPTRERFRAQLMLALYRTGRQAEAFTVFHEAWRFCTEELGVEPGPQIRNLHQRILAADQSLLGVPSADPPCR